MLSRSVKIAAGAVGAIAILIACAMQFLPTTLYFPATDYSVPGNIRFVMRENGVLEKSRCERRTEEIARQIRMRCPTCGISQSCSRGLDAEAKQVLSKEPLPGPSVRSESGKLTMTISADDPQVALAACRQLQAQTTSQPPNAKLRCFPPGVER
jgi:hypothetical protein